MNQETFLLTEQFLRVFYGVVIVLIKIIFRVFIFNYIMTLLINYNMQCMVFNGTEFCAAVFVYRHICIATELSFPKNICI